MNECTDVPLPVGAPWVTQLLKRAAESDDIGIEMSESDDVEGHPGITAVLYNKKDDKEGELNALAATTIAKLGAQADCPAVTPYERVLAGAGHSLILVTFYFFARRKRR